MRAQTTDRIPYPEGGDNSDGPAAILPRSSACFGESDQAPVLEKVMFALRSICSALFFITATFVAQPSAATGDAGSAAFTFIQDLGNDAAKELTDPAIPQSERDTRFRRLLVDRFDMAAISKFVLGRYWRSTNEAQREEFQHLFVDFIVGSYSVRFSAYLGEGVKVTGTSVDGGTILVHSKIDMPSSEDICVDWLLRHADGNFAIVDIIIEGVSMSVTQRSEFASVIQNRGGVSGLIEALRTENLQSANRSTQR
jgi:phospholipid transport system substrate-binding protein